MQYQVFTIVPDFPPRVQEWFNYLCDDLEVEPWSEDQLTKNGENVRSPSLFFPLAGAEILFPRKFRRNFS